MWRTDSASVSARYSMIVPRPALIEFEPREAGQGCFDLRPLAARRGTAHTHANVVRPSRRVTRLQGGARSLECRPNYMDVQRIAGLIQWQPHAPRSGETYCLKHLHPIDFEHVMPPSRTHPA